MELRIVSPVALLLLLAGTAIGCGSGATTTTTGSGPKENSTVTVVGSSTANDQLADYDLVLNTLTLTDQKGTSVSVVSAPLHVEFIHLNGAMEPLVTTSLPQGTYVSATATVSLARFDCVSLNSSGAVVVSAFVDNPPPASAVTVNLPTPITIATGASTLSLNLLVSKSASWTTCATLKGAVDQFSTTPTFDLTPFAAHTPFMTGLEGQVASVDAAANTLSVTADDGSSCESSDPSACAPASANGPVWEVVGNASTLMQGVSRLSQLQPGMPVEIDGSLQADGSILADRVSVVDTNAANVTGYLGPTLFLSEAWPVLNALDLEAWGPAGVGGSEYFNFANATFQTSGDPTDLQNLPFDASFTASNIIDGQRILVTSHANSIAPAPTYAPATTITLLPQTINGTVTAVSSVSGFDVYTVALAPYDLFPQLATQGGQTTLLQNPNTVTVYLSNSSPSSTPVAVGSVFRFTGLVFNDGGTLKMDCASVSSGVAE